MQGRAESRRSRVRWSKLPALDVAAELLCKRRDRDRRVARPAPWAVQLSTTCRDTVGLRRHLVGRLPGGNPLLHVEARTACDANARAERAILTRHNQRQHREVPLLHMRLQLQT